MFLQSKLQGKAKVKSVNKSGKPEEDDEQPQAAAEPQGQPFVYGPAAPLPQGAMLIVDPLSSGAFLAAEFHTRGVPVVRVMSRSFPPALLAHVPGCELVWADSIQHNPGEMAATVKQIRDLPYPIIGCLAGAETGVEVADELCTILGLRCNDMKTSELRRNKFKMSEAVRAAGVRAVKQALCSRWEEAEHFVVNELRPEPFNVIIKPIESAGSDGVFLCKSMAELKLHFDELVGELNVLGLVNSHVVVQEFLDGPEYVVDTVSLNGKHKVVTLWSYDKRPCNGKSFIYYGIRMHSIEEPFCRQLAEYMLTVLDALQLHEGPGHGEVKWVKDGPCLIEVGARPHGGGGTWKPIADRCLGYSQFTASADTFIDPARFHSLPDFPTLTRFYGGEVYGVATKGGIIKSLPLLPKLRAVESWVAEDICVKPGDPLSVTIDIMEIPGCVVLIADSKAKFERDYEQCRNIWDDPAFFQFEDEDEIDHESSVLMSPMLRSFAPNKSSLSASLSNSYTTLRTLAGARGGTVGSFSTPYDHPQMTTPSMQMVMSQGAVNSVREAIIGSLGASKRAGSVVGSLSLRAQLASTHEPGLDAVVFVDPMSTGALVAAELYARGVKIVRVLSRHFPPAIANLVPEGVNVDYACTVQHEGGTDPAAIRKTQKMLQLLPFNFVSLGVGCETGVEVAEALAAAMNLPGNNPANSEWRRNKFTMIEKIRAAGVRGALQAIVNKWEEVVEFITNVLKPDPFLVIIKPIESAGSDGVYLCKSMEDLRVRFDQLLGELNVLGLLNEKVVLQEFLDGTEYVVDTVTWNGQHKVSHLWEYDKRPANGKNFMYFGMKPVDAAGEALDKTLIEYFLKVLDALEFKYGCAHGEIKMTNTGPVLVEVGARPHGGEGTWMPVMDECSYTSQVESYATVLCNDVKRWNDTPALSKLKPNKYGGEVYFVSSVAGKLIEHRQEIVQRITSMPSFLKFDWWIKPGEQIKVTVDCISLPGSCVLLTKDRAQFDKDLDYIHSFQSELFVVEEDRPSAAAQPAPPQASFDNPKFS